jgi:hypothetical protein
MPEQHGGVVVLITSHTLEFPEPTLNNSNAAPWDPDVIPMCTDSGETITHHEYFQKQYCIWSPLRWCIFRFVLMRIF